MTVTSRLERMSLIELETLRNLCIIQQLCKNGELESFFLVLTNEVEKVIKMKRKDKGVQ